MSARRAALALVVFVAAGLALAWIDVLPGGWALRGWVTPHAVRHAREHAAHRARRLAAFEAERAGAPEGAVVFLGSSTIERFPLAERFPGVPCLDRGIGEESLPELLDRLERSLPAAPPAGAVLYLGSIDFRVHDRAPARIAALAELALRFLREGRPDLPLAVIGILPERDMPPAMVERLAATNASLAALCARTGVAFVRTDRPPVTGPDGSLVPASAADRLHLNGAGYRALARWLVEDGGAVGRLLAGPGGG